MAVTAAIESHTAGFAPPRMAEAVAEGFARETASACGFALDWLQEQLFAPSIYVNGFWAGSTGALWQTRSPSLTGSWVSDSLTTEAGDIVGWQTRCGTPAVGIAEVWNRHAFGSDDLMGTLRVPFARIPPAAFCDGWGWLQGSEGDGIVGATVLVRTSTRPDCEALGSRTFADHVIRN